MKNIFLYLPLIVSALFLSNCANLSSTASTDADTGKKINKAYKKFTKKKDYKKSYAVYKDEALYAKANRQNTSVHISLPNQRAQLLVNGAVAVDAPCTTGKTGKRTPRGTFRITEKIVTKRSTIFGSLYKNGKKVYGGDRRKYSGSYDKYVGSPLPYWMRLTGDGIGMHSSRGVKRYPASNGCIRLQKNIVQQVFSKTKVGTRVTIGD